MKFPIKKEIAVFYSPDDIGAASKLSDLDFLINVFHEKYPQIQVILQTVPYNLLIYDDNKQNIETVDESYTNEINGRSLWKLLQLGENYEWITLGNHGYYHRPPNGSRTDHEFNPICDPQAVKYEYCYERLNKARQAYANIGLNNNEILLMRFPGHKYTSEALRALRDLNFLGFFQFTPDYQEKWNNLTDGNEFLGIPTIPLIYFYHNKSNIQDFIERKVEIYNLFDHFWEMAESDNFDVFCNVINALIDEYGEKIWWCSPIDIACRLYIERNSYFATLTNSLIEIKVDKWDTRWKSSNITIKIEFTSRKNLKVTSPNKEVHYVTERVNYYEGICWVELPAVPGIKLNLSFQ